MGAELGVSRGRASSQMQYGLTLLERLPKLAAVFAAGEIDFWVFTAIGYRTGLIVDAGVLAGIDEMLARKAPQWNKLSREKVAQLVDWLVVDVDPEAVRVARQCDVDRHIVVEPDQNGMAEIWGSVRALDAAVFDRRLDQRASTVCRDDPRTQRQRRADALAPADQTAAPQPLQTAPPTRSSFMCWPRRARSRASAKAGFLPGYGALPAEAVKDMARRAKIRPLILPQDWPAEPRYRPSAALADVVRCRDLTCRFPNCDRPAEVCDIDHTVPYPVGPTHPSNLKLYCRIHRVHKRLRQAK